MRLIRLIINNKEAKFKGNTLITSKKNTSGKTTFIRLILYSVGWNIPSTKKINFSKLVTRLYVDIDKQLYCFVRHNTDVDIYRNGKYIDKFDTRSDLNELLSIYSTLSSPFLLDNLLGTFYFDQEEGWNWLSKGKVIGGYRFNIGEFIEGLNNDDQSKIREKIAIINQELKGYNLLKKNLTYKQAIDLNTKYDWNDFDKLNARLRTIEFNIAKLRKKITTLSRARKNNDHFISMIADMKLKIKTKHGDEELVTKDNICGFSDQRSFITARLSILKREEKQHINEKYKIENELKKFTKLFNIQSQLDRFNDSISELNIDLNSVEKIINNLRNEKSNLNKELEDIISKNNYAQKIRERIIEFCKELKIDQYINDNEDNLFSLELKKYTGAVLHLLAFAFHLAYLSVLQEKKKQVFPIIIDSPFGNEITNENVKLMYSLLNKKFSNNQIITASINDISRFSNVENKIIFNGSMLKSLEFVGDIKENVNLLNFEWD